MKGKISVTILDDHQGIIDGYLYRLSQADDIRVMNTLMYGDELEPALEQNPVDVLILDVQVPTSATNTNPYPILYLIPRLLEHYPKMAVLVISMHKERVLVRKVMEAGSSGYILKDDRAAIVDLPSIIRTVHNGGIYLSQPVARLLLKSRNGDEMDSLLTPRQVEVLSLCAAYPETTTEQLAERLSIANSTLRNLLSGAYLRLGVPNRAAAIARARELGLIS